MFYLTLVKFFKTSQFKENLRINHNCKIDKSQPFKTPESTLLRASRINLERFFEDLAISLPTISTKMP